jgi:hypothetical protein
VLRNCGKLKVIKAERQLASLPQRKGGWSANQRAVARMKIIMPGYDVGFEDFVRHASRSTRFKSAFNRGRWQFRNQSGP